MRPAETRRRLGEAAAQLLWARSRLRVLHEELLATVPESAPEADLDPEADPGEVERMRTAIGCGLHDRLEPLIRDLLDAAGVAEEEAEPSPGPQAEPRDPRDLGPDSESLRRVLLAHVVADNFTPLPDAESGEMLESLPYTPQQAQLQVVPLAGRWFAAWQKLDEPEGRSECRRWELLLLQRDPKRPGGLLYDEI